MLLLLRRLEIAELIDTFKKLWTKVINSFCFFKKYPFDIFGHVSEINSEKWDFWVKK